MRLDGKVVLVTGAGSGLGAATAVACARSGAAIWMVDRNMAGMTDTAARIADLGVEAAAHTADLTSRDACFEAVNRAIDHFGRLDALCNVAGIVRFDRFCEVTEAEWTQMIAIILSAPFYLSQAAIPELLRNHGSIVNVASSGGLKGSAYHAPYGAAKAGLVHMTRCMAMEYMHQPIRINAIAPGAMRTNIMAGGSIPEDLDRDLIRRFTGMRPPADPMEAANMIAYMLSDASPSLHGAIVSVDGGVTAG